MKTRMHKKGDGMSLNLIVVAALALIILVVLIVVFVGKTGRFANQTTDTEQFYTNSCEVPGTMAKCRTTSECSSVGGFSLGKKGCSDVCCSQ